jgi:uncharacterized protein (DUF488 family)
MRPSVVYSVRNFGDSLERIAMNSALVIIKKIHHLLNDVHEFMDMRADFRWFLKLNKGAAYRLRCELAYCIVEYHEHQQLEARKKQTHDMFIEFTNNYHEIIVHYEFMTIKMRHSILNDSIVLECRFGSSRRIARIMWVGELAAGAASLSHTPYATRCEEVCSAHLPHVSCAARLNKRRSRDITRESIY